LPEAESITTTFSCEADVKPGKNTDPVTTNELENEAVELVNL